MQKKRIFISHPFQDNPLENKKRAQKICIKVLEEGYLPISPLHLFGYMDNDDNRKDVLRMCLDVIPLCDEIWLYGDSDGCTLEKEHAEKLKIPIKMKY